MTELIARVRYANGYRDVSDGGTGEVRYFFYAADDVKDTATADAIGAAVLDQLAGPRTTYTVDAVTMPAVIQNEDTVTFPTRSSTASAKVRGRRMDIDANGFVRPTLVLNDQKYVSAEKAALALKRLSGGTLGGRAAGASPVTSTSLGIPVGPLRQVSLSPWSWSGTSIDTDAEAPLQPPIDFYGVICKLSLSITPTPYPDGDFTATITQNGSDIRSVTLPATEALATCLAGAFTISPGDTIGAKISAVDAAWTALADDSKSPYRLTLGTVVAPSRVEPRSE